MSEISAEFVRLVATVWHRFEPREQSMEELAAMLAPMDDAGEACSRHLTFDMEPADFLLAQDALADPEDQT